MRSRLPVVVALVILVLLQANPVVNWFATRATARAARAAHPNEAHFVDSYVDSSTYLVGVWSALSLLVGAALVVMALLVRPGRRWAAILLTIGLVGAFAFTLCATFVNTGSSLWTGPDEWDTVADSVPGWQGNALVAASMAVALGVLVAIRLTWPRAPRPAPPQPQPQPIAPIA
jgi:hypothetical protein